MVRVSAVLLCLALILAGCGSDDPASDQAVASLEERGSVDVDARGDDVEADAEEAMLAFTECLREEGLEIEDPEYDLEGNLRFDMPMGDFTDRMGREDSRQAFDACSHLLMGAIQMLGGFDVTMMEDRLVEYAACMRENGFEMADPDFTVGEGPGGMGGGMGPFAGIDADDPDFQAANEECQQLFMSGFGDFLSADS